MAVYSELRKLLIHFSKKNAFMVKIHKVTHYLSARYSKQFGFSPGGSVSEVGREVSHPSAEADERDVSRPRQLRGAVCLRRGRHGEAVLQRPARASPHQQARRDLPSHISM